MQYFQGNGKPPVKGANQKLIVGVAENAPVIKRREVPTLRFDAYFAGALIAKLRDLGVPDDKIPFPPGTPLAARERTLNFAGALAKDGKLDEVARQAVLEATRFAKQVEANPLTPSVSSAPTTSKPVSPVASATSQRQEQSEVENDSSTPDPAAVLLGASTLR